MKICTKCRKQKPLDCFNKANHHKDDLTSHCKECLKKDSQKWLQNNHDAHRKRVQKYRKEHKWMSSYSCAKQRCTNKNNSHYKYYGGRGIKCLITTDELKELWFRDKAYEMNKPSIDRIDNDGHYEYENCRFIELSENVEKSNFNTARRKAVLQYDLDGNFIREWPSATDASNYIKACVSTLSACCRGEQKTCKSFKWEYKYEDAN